MFLRNKNNLPVIVLRRRSVQFFPTAVDDDDHVNVVDEQEAGNRGEGQVGRNDVRVAKIFLNDDLWTILQTKF